MTLEQLIPLISGNVAALFFLYAWQRSEKERVALQDQYNRTLLAFAGYRTEPDTQNIVKMDNQPPDARAKGTFPPERP